jgi:hypothetical protein
MVTNQIKNLDLRLQKHVRMQCWLTCRTSGVSSYLVPVNINFPQVNAYIIYDCNDRALLRWGNYCQHNVHAVIERGGGERKNPVSSICIAGCHLFHESRQIVKWMQTYAHACFKHNALVNVFLGRGAEPGLPRGLNKDIQAPSRESRHFCGFLNHPN